MAANSVHEQNSRRVIIAKGADVRFRRFCSIGHSVFGQPPDENATTGSLSTSMTELTEKQKRFVREYLVDLNGTAAAKRAGYAARSAYSIAHELLRKPDIATAVARGLAQECAVTRTRIVDEIAGIAFANAGDYFQWGPDGIVIRDSRHLTEEQCAVVSEASQTKNAQGGGSVRIKLYDKLAALARLARLTGLDAPRGEVTGAPGDEAPVRGAHSDLELAKRVALLLAKGLKQESQEERQDGPAQEKDREAERAENPER